MIVPPEGDNINISPELWKTFYTDHPTDNNTYYVEYGDGSKKSIFNHYNLEEEDSV